jgi:hypothetical protein
MSGNGWLFDKGSILHQIFRFGEETVWFENGKPTGMFFIDMSRILLLLTFAGIAYLVHIASKKRKYKVQIEHND